MASFQQSFAFRLLGEADLDITRCWRNHPDSLQWFGDTQPLTREAQHRWFSARTGIVGDEIYLLLSSEGQPLGQFSVYRIDYESGRAEVGRFLVDPSLRGHGYFDEGLGRLLAKCRELHGLREVYLSVRVDNARAIRAYCRNGFRAAGVENGMLSMRRDLRT